MQRQLPEIVAADGQHVEGVSLHLFIVLAGVQALIRSAVHTEHDSLAIDHELLFPIPQRGLDDPRISLGPIVAVLGDQPHAIAVTANDQAKPIVLYFVDPVGAGWNFGAAGWDAGLERKLTHRAGQR